MSRSNKIREKSKKRKKNEIIKWKWNNAKKRKNIKYKQKQHDEYMRLHADAYACVQPYEAPDASTTKCIKTRTQKCRLSVDTTLRKKFNELNENKQKSRYQLVFYFLEYIHI